MPSTKNNQGSNVSGDITKYNTTHPLQYFNSTLPLGLDKDHMLEMIADD